MFKVGDFARMSGTSVKTLHHYDEVGLLRPVHVDPETGYRYYSTDQLMRLAHIRTLKDFGFSLDQISVLLESSLDRDRMVELLRLKQAEVAERVREEQARLERVTRHLREWEATAKRPDFAFTVRPQPEIRTAAVCRPLIDTDAEAVAMTIRDGFFHLYSTLGRNRVTPTGPSIIYWQDIRGESETGDIVMATPVANLPTDPALDGIFEFVLPAVEQMAVLTHHGPLSEIGDSYLALFDHLKRGGYRIVGARRDVVLQYAGTADGDSISELQFPVSKEVKP